MRIYQNCTEAITDIGRELKKCATTVHTQTMQNKYVAGNKDFETKEIQAFQFCILDQSDKDSMPNVHVTWCNAEIKERLNTVGMNPGEAWRIREDVWEQFLVQGKFDYTYSERIAWQLSWIIKEIQIHPETRQAIIEVHDRGVDTYRMGTQRIPCSMFYQFMLRDGKLDVIYVMRSTDFFTHFQNDIWLACALRDYIAEKTGHKPGKFIMFASSLHAYRKDWEQLKNY